MHPKGYNSKNDWFFAELNKTLDVEINEEISSSLINSHFNLTESGSKYLNFTLDFITHYFSTFFLCRSWRKFCHNNFMS
jgi:predicted PurR-regulated permease PerM